MIDDKCKLICHKLCEFYQKCEWISTFICTQYVSITVSSIPVFVHVVLDCNISSRLYSDSRIRWINLFKNLVLRLNLRSLAIFSKGGLGLKLFLKSLTTLEFEKFFPVKIRTWYKNMLVVFSVVHRSSGKSGN